MFKNLNAQTLGISGRQSDLIELAMTYGFQGLDIDALDLERRTSRTDFERATRFLLSSKMKVSGFDVPCDLDADDSEFEKAIGIVESVVKVAGKVKARAGYLVIPPATNKAPFPQFFELMKTRIVRLAKIFEENGVLLGLSLTTFQEDREGKQYPFIQDVNGALALIGACASKSVGFVVDTYHWTAGQGTFEQLATLPPAQVAGLNIADIAESVDVKNSSRVMKLPAGTCGKIDNYKFVESLAYRGYDGPVTSCPDPANVGTITRDTTVSKAQDAIDAALKQAGLQTNTRKPEIVAAQSSTGFDPPGFGELP